MLFCRISRLLDISPTQPHQNRARTWPLPMKHHCDWKKYLDLSITMGDLLSGRFQQGPHDLVLAVDGLDFCLCGLEISPGDFFREGTRPSFYCAEVYMEVWIGHECCWAPLSPNGARLFADFAAPRVLAAITADPGPFPDE